MGRTAGQDGKEKGLLASQEMNFTSAVFITKCRTSHLLPGAPVSKIEMVATCTLTARVATMQWPAERNPEPVPSFLRVCACSPRRDSLPGLLASTRKALAPLPPHPEK